MKLIARLKYILYILLFLFSSEILAQEFNISGIVVDGQNKSVAFANVLLLTEDKTIITGTSSLEDGTFNLKNLEPKPYILKVTFIGYRDFYKTFSLSKNKDFGNIIIKEDTESLEEVKIKTVKPTLKKEIDRLVFNVANTALSEGNLLEVIRNTPGVLILDNNITVKNSTPTVYINDRKVNLSASEITQLLESSPANAIKKIEVITNPPAKYDAESGAVLNIVMSRNLITGYRGNIFTNYTQGVFPRYNAGINQFYKTKKININLNYSFTKSKINRENDDFVNYTTEIWNTNNNRNTRSNTHNVNLNFDYFIDDKNTLSFATNGLLLPFFDYEIKGRTNVIDASNNQLFNFNSFNNSKDSKYNLGFDLDFVHRFKNKSKLSLNTHFTDYDYNRDQKVNSRYFFLDPMNNFNTAFNTNSNQNTNIFNSRLDYTWPISDNSEFSTGIKNSYIETNSDILRFDINQITNEEEFNVTNSNTYQYEESIFAAYISYSKNWKKWNFSGGLRIEHTNVDGLSITNNERNKQDYYKLFPTLNLSLQASENTSIYTNYKRSISRPSYQSLNPFNFFLNDNTVVTGNPILQPTFIDSFTIGTTVLDTYTFEVYYNGAKNAFFELPIQNNNDNIIVFSPTNISKTREFGFDFTTNFNITEHWSVYFYNSLYNIENQSIIVGGVSKLNQWSLFSSLSNDFSFLKDKSLKLNYSMTYIGKNQQGFRISESLLNTNLSIKKTVFKKKGTLSLSFSDLFNTQDFDVAFRLGNNQNSRNQINLDNRYVKLGFSYKFGNTTLKTNERVKELNERERLEK